MAKLKSPLMFTWPKIVHKISTDMTLKESVPGHRDNLRKCLDARVEGISLAR